VRYDKGSADRAVYAPKHAMPRSWQEYQALQARVEAIAGETIGDCTAQERAQANEFMQKLQEFYPSFKSILAEGWRLDGDPTVDDAIDFVIQLEARGVRAVTRTATTARKEESFEATGMAPGDAG